MNYLWGKLREILDFFYILWYNMSTFLERDYLGNIVFFIHIILVILLKKRTSKNSIKKILKKKKLYDILCQVSLVIELVIKNQWGDENGK